MRPSGERLADDNYGVRASDAERDQAIGELRNRFAEGRLSQETFLCRMDAALNARDRSDLDELFTDLPAAPQRGARRTLRDRLVSLLRAGRAGTRSPKAYQPAELPAPAAAGPAVHHRARDGLRLHPCRPERLALACPPVHRGQSVAAFRPRLDQRDQAERLAGDDGRPGQAG